MPDEQIYDIVIYGSTGFTGQFVLEEALLEATTSGGRGTRICAAGRSLSKLEAVVAEACTLHGLSRDLVALEVVDVDDHDGLVRLASKTKVLVTCVGPYREYGLQVVKACIEGGANCIDISGEPQYLEAVQAELSTEAQDKGVHVVGSCGFDSVPADMGTLFLYDNFPGGLCHVEMLAGHSSNDGFTPSIHATTLQCAVLGYANRHKLRANRSKILDRNLQMPPYQPPKRGSLWYHSDSAQWCVANLASDRSVVQRSQYLLHHLYDKQPVHFSAYFAMHSLWAAIKALLFGAVFVAMSSFNCTRDMLIKHPEFFTIGMFSWAGPQREELRRMSFKVLLTGAGWNHDAASRPLEERGPPDTVRVCTVKGPDPGYYGTAIIVVQCAFTILKEKDKMPQGGGVFTPAAAFGNTSLISRLQAKGITFSMGTP